jgi:hypothetical protein
MRCAVAWFTPASHDYKVRGGLRATNARLAAQTDPRINGDDQGPSPRRNHLSTIVSGRREAPNWRRDDCARIPPALCAEVCTMAGQVSHGQEASIGSSFPQPLRTRA